MGEAGLQKNGANGKKMRRKMEKNEKKIGMMSEIFWGKKIKAPEWNEAAA